MDACGGGERPPSKCVLVVTTGFPAHPRDLRGIFLLRGLKYLLKESEFSAIVVVPQSEEPAPLFAAREPWQDKLEIARYAYAPRQLQLLTRGSIPANLRRAPLLWLQVPWLLAAGALALLRHARRAQILHCHWLASALLPVLLRRWHGKPVLLTLHGSDIALMNSGVLRCVNRFILGRCDKVLPVTRLLKQAVAGLCDCGEVVPVGVDAEVFHPASAAEKRALRHSIGIEESRVILICAGMLIPVKGLDLLIEAAALLKTMELPPFLIVLLGDGIERPRLQELAEKRGCAHLLRFVGTIPPHEAPTWTRCADIALSTSHSEGLSTALCEAAACALPIVATRAGDTGMIVAEGENGTILEQRDPAALAERCAWLIADGELRRRMGARGRELLVERRLTSAACAQGYLAAYRELLAERASRA